MKIQARASVLNIYESNGVFDCELIDDPHRGVIQVSTQFLPPDAKYGDAILLVEDDGHFYIEKREPDPDKLKEKSEIMDSLINQLDT